MKKVFTAILFLNIIAQLSAQTLNFKTITHNYDLLESVDKVIITDLNGDNQPDFIVNEEGRQKLYVGLNNQLEKPSFTLIGENSLLIGITAADFDLDGDIDILASAPFDNASYWWENDGSANFTQNTLSINNYEGIHLADLDGDDQAEVIISIDDGLHIYKNDKGILTRQSTLFESFFGDDSPAIQTFDNNGDSLVDIAATFNREGVLVYQQTGNLNFEEIEIDTEIFNQSSLFVTDLNQDGGIDFITHGVFGGSSSIVTNNNDGTYTTVKQPQENGRNEFTTVGDVDNDGDDDIIYYEEASSFSGTISLLTNNGGVLEKSALSDEYSKLKQGK